VVVQTLFNRPCPRTRTGSLENKGHLEKCWRFKKHKKNKAKHWVYHHQRQLATPG